MAKLHIQPSTAASPSTTLSAFAGKKPFEEVYQKRTQLEHILLRPDTYICSVKKHTQRLWVFEDGKMVLRDITYVPGLCKIFDEILVNAADNEQRDSSTDTLMIEINTDENLISVYNNGVGVPVEIHQEEGVYVPEMIFGHLMASSNYDDSVKRTTGGRNGYGAKLTNIFSTEFVIEIADGKRQKMYKQVFSENMGKKSEPSITKCKEGENWTKVSFKPDLAKFNMTHLEAEVVALMKKRVVDLAATLGESVKVMLNRERVPVKNFRHYVNLYLDSVDKNREEPLPRIWEKVKDRWELCVSLSDGQFQQVSFVNGINTIKGGTHVDYVTGQIVNHMSQVLKKKTKGAKVMNHHIKNQLWVFVNALIDNPAFDSQTKETLTSHPRSFGSECELSQGFLERVKRSSLMANLLSWVEFKQVQELKKNDGIQSKKINIPKLDDADDAGGLNSEKCTLILTEGDSAKALAVAGVSELGRDYYGVFPLKGKLLNVREASLTQIVANAEIQNIKKILGLQHGKQYDSVKGLRYGHLMIMTDQDHDGSHIKGLLINFIHSFWPSLIKIKGFLMEFITPIVKATHRNGNVLSFYTMPEYESWKKSLGGNASGWSIKYYKGLGTSTVKEGKEYFRALDKHKKIFVWEDEQDGDAIELAFSKKMIEGRKNWLRHFEPGTYLDQTVKNIRYKDFVNKELILFSIADLQRSVPSMVDGLKPGQRKILFCAFKRNFVKEAKVAQFSGYVSEHSAYHHGEASLANTIVGMAQDFVGSNNINLLQPNGQFGTRMSGGKDASSSRYIYTCLSHITRFLFHKDDDLILDYLNEDGQSIEPTWYVPVIPMVLINGGEGIGTGWSTFIPNYNPRDVVANLKRLLNGEPMQPMDPWYRGFKGSIEKSIEKETGFTYTASGVIKKVDNNALLITELPIHRWTSDYDDFLRSITITNDKNKKPFIQEFKAKSDDVSVHFKIYLSEENMNVARQEGLLKKFKLTSTIATSNMHLFDTNGDIKKYDTPEQIIEDFFSLRILLYEKRKRATLDILEAGLLKLENEVRFILAVVRGEIIVSNRKREDLLLELYQKGFSPLRVKTKDLTETQDSQEVLKGRVRASDYAYLITMPIASLILENVNQICAEKAKLENELEELRNTSPRALWMKDLDALETQLDRLDRKNAQAEKIRQNRREEKEKMNGGTAVTRVAAKIPRENNKASAAGVTDAGNASEAGKSKPRDGQEKAAASEKNKAVGSDDNGKLKFKLMAPMVNLMAPMSKARLAVLRPYFSPLLAMNADKKKEPSKRAAARRVSDDEDEDIEEQLPTTSEDGDSDEDSEIIETEAPPKGKKGAAGGKKQTNTNAKITAATTRKRGALARGKLRQKVITNVLKPVENASPQKKVRKMRDSPFNKKSGSVISRVGGSPAESSEVSGGSSSLSTNLEAEMNEAPIVRRSMHMKEKNRVKISLFGERF